MPTGLYLQATLGSLVSRASIFAIALLILNDHLLKANFASKLTGKLSDFAGLYFTPYVILVALFALIRTVRWPLLLPAAERAALAVYLIHSGLFIALKAVPSASEALIALAEALTGHPQLVVVDPTDLFALSVLPFSYVAWHRRLVAACRQPAARGEQGPARLPLLFQLAVVAVASLAITATTPNPWQPGVVSIAADPRDGRVLYAVVADVSSGTRDRGRPAEIRKARLYRSINRGTTWSEVGEGGHRVLVDPFDPGGVYVARDDGVWAGNVSNWEPRRVWPPTGQASPEGRAAYLVEAAHWTTPVLYVVNRGTVWLPLLQKVSRSGGLRWPWTTHRPAE